MNERDKVIVEFFGICVHQFNIDWDKREINEKHFCEKCGVEYNKATYPPQLNTPEGFFWLLSEMKSHPLWFDFINVNGITWSLIDPEKFANTVYKFITNIGVSKDKPDWHFYSDF